MLIPNACLTAQTPPTTAASVSGGPNLPHSPTQAMPYPALLPTPLSSILLIADIPILIQA